MNQIQLLKERQTIEDAIENLENSIGTSIDWTQNNASDNGIDGFLTLYDQTFAIEHKPSFSLSMLPAITDLKNKFSNLILITNSLTEHLKKVLKDNKIQYLDTIGNAYIQVGSIFILSESKKVKQKPQINKDKAFTKKGIVVVFHLLNDETLLNSNYRNISAVTETSLDTVTKVIQSLKQQRFIYQIDAKTMRLIDKKRLFEKWTDAYENRLKPHLFVGSFRFQNIDAEINWHDLALNHNSTWGGEPAADILTNFMRPSIFTLYSTEKKADLMRNYRFIPDMEGNIKVYTPFFKLNSQKTTEPLLVYADMLNSGDSRNLEVAQKIYENYVKNILK
jgi:hypothetical protein